MTYIIALISTFLLTGGMFAFVTWVASQVEKWKNQSLELSVSQQVMIEVALFLQQTWFIIVPLLLVIHLIIAYLISNQKRERS